MPALEHYPQPIDFDALKRYLWNEFKIANFGAVNHDASVTTSGYTDSAISFDRARKPDGGVLLMECKAPTEKPLSPGQETHLKHWHELNPRKITVLLVGLSGTTVDLEDRDGKMRPAWNFEPIAYRVCQRYQHQGVVKTGWREERCTPVQFYASMANWYKTGTWTATQLRSVA